MCPICRMILSGRHFFRKCPQRSKCTIFHSATPPTQPSIPPPLPGKFRFLEVPDFDVTLGGWYYVQLVNCSESLSLACLSIYFPPAMLIRFFKRIHVLWRRRRTQRTFFFAAAAVVVALSLSLSNILVCFWMDTTHGTLI